MAELAARHVAVEPLAVELEARGHALDDRGQAGAVGFPGGDEVEARHERDRVLAAVEGAARVAGAEVALPVVVLDGALGRRLLVQV